MFNMFLQPIDTYCKLSHDFSPLTPRTSGSKAAGVESFYQIIYQHWEAPLKELHLARLASAKSKGSGDLSDGLVVIPDDDDNLESLESKSLEQAMQGIIVEGVIVLDDGYDSPEKKVKDSMQELPKPFHMNIDYVLNPPGLPHRLQHLRLFILSVTPGWLWSSNSYDSQ